MTKTPPRNRARGRDLRSTQDSGPVWIWGVHAVAAARANPRRKVLRLAATENAARRLDAGDADLMSPRDLERLLPAGAVHQGIALLAEPLEPAAIEGVIEAGGPVAVLDQVSDPGNLGAVFRSAAAFGVRAMVLQTRHAPPITGVVAKAAAGAVEAVAECRVVNVARALDTLAEAGWTNIGLAGEAEAPLDEALQGAAPLSIVLGAEGEGLRPAVAKACQRLARIPISPGMESLNVSNAAAVAFYEAARAR